MARVSTTTIVDPLFWRKTHLDTKIDMGLLALSFDNLYNASATCRGAILVKVLTVITALAGQTITLIGITFLYVWLYNHTRSLIVVIIFHALYNTLNAIPFGEMQPIMTLFIAIMPWVVVFALEKILPKGEFPSSPANVSNKDVKTYSSYGTNHIKRPTSAYAGKCR